MQGRREGGRSGVEWKGEKERNRVKRRREGGRKFCGCGGRWKKLKEKKMDIGREGDGSWKRERGCERSEKLVEGKQEDSRSRREHYWKQEKFER